ncbi:MAG: type I-C CRISPR-associated endonuclease Cas1 [Phycisphaeraceae bacterium]|nr:type I-C CRISPR-associated endonuclease Cas1 [Phycisphaeraceae bacterium]
MKQHLNTLFVMTEGAYLAKDGSTVAVRVEQEVRLRVPFHNLGGIVCLGRIGVSPALMSACGEAGIAISLCTEHGRFLARISGFTPGNVLLRREQYRRADDPSACAVIVRGLLAGKIANSRTVLMRALRDRPGLACEESLERAVVSLGASLRALERHDDPDRLRGLEGDAANVYFAVFNGLVTDDSGAFKFTSRSRRPPLDRMNSLLSFLYAMLAHDARSACESVGLDPAVGFLHRDRPGRPGLALDLMEEFRPFLADRLALSLVNRGQVKPSGFTVAPNGAVTMHDSTRREVVAAYQRRKQEFITHPFLGEKTTVGLLIHLQARLLSRHIRGDLDAYPPFVWQ